MSPTTAHTLHLLLESNVTIHYIMAEKITGSAEFDIIWKSALADFFANTKISLAHENELLHLQNIDELLLYLTREHAKYDKDSASSKFSSIVKTTLGPLKFLLSMGGKAAGDVGQSLGRGICCRWAFTDLSPDVSWWLASPVSTQHLHRGKF